MISGGLALDLGSVGVDITPLQKSLGKKGPRYGKLDSPFLVAVLMLRDFAEDRDVESALFGTHRWSYVQCLRKEDPALAPHWIRLNDGYFLRGSGPATQESQACWWASA